LSFPRRRSSRTYLRPDCGVLPPYCGKPGRRRGPWPGRLSTCRFRRGPLASSSCGRRDREDNLSRGLSRRLRRAWTIPPGGTRVEVVDAHLPGGDHLGGLADHFAKSPWPSGTRGRTSYVRRNRPPRPLAPSCPASGMRRQRGPVPAVRRRRRLNPRRLQPARLLRRSPCPNGENQARQRPLAVSCGTIGHGLALVSVTNSKPQHAPDAGRNATSARGSAAGGEGAIWGLPCARWVAVVERSEPQAHDGCLGSTAPRPKC
jgi:hypothetical protein